MIENPSAIFATLVSVVGGVAWLSSRPQLKRFFSVVSGVLFVYFIPTRKSGGPHPCRVARGHRRYGCRLQLDGPGVVSVGLSKAI